MASDAPAGRAGHSLTLVAGRLLLFGGFSDVYHGDLFVYNDNGLWINIEPRVTSPRPRFGHVAFAHDDSLYIFGGDTGYRCLNDVWKYSVFDGTWTLLEVHGEIPPGRSCMTGTVRNDKLIIFGGADRYANEGPKYYNDIYTMDIKTGYWTLIKTQGDLEAACNVEEDEANILERIPEAVESQGMSHQFSSDTELDKISEGSFKETDLDASEEKQESIEIATSNNNSNNNTSPKINSNSNTQLPQDIKLVNSVVGTSSMGTIDSLCQPKNQGPGVYPRPRRGQVMFFMGRNMYIFGGVDKDNKFLNDLWILNLDTYTWKEVSSCRETEGERPGENMPCARAFATYRQFGNYFFMFGGVSEKDYLDDFWTFDPETDTFTPCQELCVSGSRGNHSRQSARDASISTSINVSASSQKQQRLSRGSPNIKNDVELYYRPTTARTQEMIKINRSSTIGRYGAAMEFKKGKLTLFGGYSYLGMMNDTWEIAPSNMEEIAIAEHDDELTSTVPMTEDDISYEFVMHGFEKFIKEKIDKLAEEYDANNTQVSEVVNDFRNELLKMIDDLDSGNFRVRDNYENTKNTLETMKDKFITFTEENKMVIEQSGELNEVLRVQFAELEEEISEVLDMTNRFNEKLRAIFEELNEKNTERENELENFSDHVNGWIEETNNNLNEKIAGFTQRCEEYTKNMEDAVDKIDDMNDQQVIFFSDLASKINNFKNDMENFRQQISDNYNLLIESNEERVIGLDKQVEDLFVQVSEKRQKNYDSNDEIKRIIADCTEFFAERQKEARVENQKDEEEIKVVMDQNREKNAEALKKNKDMNENYIKDTIEENQKRCENYLNDLLVIKKNVEDTYADVDNKQKKFTESIMSDIDTSQANTAKNNSTKCDEMNHLTHDLNTDITKDDDAIKKESVDKTNECKENLIKNGDDKMNAAFDECKNNSSDMLINEEERFNKIIADIEERINQTNEKYNTYQEEVDALKKVLEELKEGKYDDYTDTLDKLERLKDGVRTTKTNLDSSIANDKNVQFKHEDDENLVKEKYEANLTEHEYISRALDNLQNLTKEGVEILAHSKENLGEYIDAQNQRLTEIENEINRVIEENNVKYNEIIDRAKAQHEMEEQEKADMVSHCDDVNNHMVETQNKIDDIRKEYNEYKDKTVNTLTDNSNLIDSSNTTCTTIDIPTERFNSAESGIDATRELNDSTKGKVDELNNKLEERERQFSEETAQRKQEFADKYDEEQAEIDKIVQDIIYTPMEESRNKCHERVDKVIGDLDKGIAIINDRADALAHEREDIDVKVDGMKNDIIANQEIIEKERDEMKLSIDRINEELTKKRTTEHKRLHLFQDLLMHFDEENKKECEDVIAWYDSMSEKTINESKDTYEKYLYVIRDLDKAFIDALPGRLELLNTDSNDLDTAVTEVRKQVRAHATELTAIKASLRDIACISEKAYESSSKLLGRVRPEDVALNE